MSAIMNIRTLALLTALTSFASPAQTAPPFSYDLYSDAQGRFRYAGADLALAQRPEHLRQVYLDADRGQARAKELVRHLEQVFHDFGIWVADATTSPLCLPLPELTPGCLPKLGFLDEMLGNTPEAARLREVVARAYEVRARERGAQSRVIAATLNLVLAAGMAKGVMERAATLGETQSAARDATGFAGHKGFELKNLQTVRNQATTINGRRFSGHALDQMQNRGVTPAVVENTIQQGQPFATAPGTSGFFDPHNSVRVIVNSETGQVVTVIRGAP